MRALDIKKSVQPSISQTEKKVKSLKEFQEWSEWLLGGGKGWMKGWLFFDSEL